ncbi:hypothetical protein K2W90_05395 [Candidatus Babeliales bacterium]|nr:hypothetical protein [Candidatus Babeliales bacterium]
MKKLLLKACVFGLFATTSLAAIDLPVFYRAPLFQGTPDWLVRDKASNLSISYMTGSGSAARNGDGSREELLGIYGAVDIARLGLYVENPGALTYPLWRDPSLEAMGDPAPQFNGFAIPNTDSPNGKVVYNGKINTYQVGLTFKQSIFSGLYFMAHAPIRHVKLYNITHKNLGAAAVNGKNVEDFITMELPAILKENGFTDINDQFSLTTVPEILVAAGWEGASTTLFNKDLKYLRGSVQIGGLIPVASRKKEDTLIAIPLGYNSLWAIDARASAELGVLEKLAVGINGGATIFFQDHRDVRLKTDANQSGFAMLGKAHTEVDYANLWHLSGYVKVEKIFQGFSALVGYSYTHQDKARVHLEDEKFLKTYADQQAARMPQPFYISKNDIINADQRWKGWQAHAVHFWAEYDVKVHVPGNDWGPVIAFEFALPIRSESKRSFAINMVGGTASLRLGWTF